MMSFSASSSCSFFIDANVGRFARASLVFAMVDALQRLAARRSTAIRRRIQYQDDVLETASTKNVDTSGVETTVAKTFTECTWDRIVFGHSSSGR